MRRATPPALLALALISTLAPPLEAQEYRDERLGFALRVPKGWTQIPVTSAEEWIVARFDSDKKDFWTDADTGWTDTHTPTLRVVAFLDAVIQKGVEVGDGDDPKKEDEGDQDDAGESKGDSRVLVRVGKIYRDYPDFLRETLKDGFYVAEKGQGERGGLPVQELDIRIERATGTGNRRLVTWIYETDLGHIAVEFDVLEQEYRKYRSAIERTLKSFETIERKQGLGLGESNLLFFTDMASVSGEERMARRQMLEDRDWERMQRSAPDGWKAMEIDGVRVLNHADEKYAKEVVARILAVRGWLEDTFPKLGEGEYARLPIVRLCADREEEGSFLESSSGLNLRGSELVTYKDTNAGVVGGETEYVNDRTFELWFADRDVQLWLARPAWLDWGVRWVLRSASVRGKRLKFDPGWVDRYLQQETRDSSRFSIEELMRMRRREFKQRIDGRDYGALFQSMVLARFLIEGEGSKSKYGDPLGTYLGNLKQVITEIEAEEKARKEKEGKTKKPETEEEEDAMIEERRKALEEKEQRILDEAFQRTFGSWPESQWSAFQRAYEKEL